MSQSAFLTTKSGLLDAIYQHNIAAAEWDRAAGRYFQFCTKLAKWVPKRISSRIARHSEERHIFAAAKPCFPDVLLIERISRLQCLGNNGLEDLRTSRNNNGCC